MAAIVLITGSTEALPKVADAVRAAGGDPVVASEPAELATALEGIGAGQLKHFLQLPESVKGDTFPSTVNQVHEFLKQGLLSRYRTAETVLPYLAPDARVIIAAGNVNTDTAAPDDRSARLSLVHVLKHAVRADLDSSAATVKVADANTDPAVLARAVLSGGELGNEDRHDKETAVDPGLDYLDWRIEVLGRVEF